MILYEAPARLDRAEIRRVRWKKKEFGIDILNELADIRSLVGPVVVEYDDVTRVQPWTKGLTHELDEPWPVHSTSEDPMTKDAITAYGANYREVAARSASLWSMTRSPRRARLYARLIARLHLDSSITISRSSWVLRSL